MTINLITQLQTVTYIFAYSIAFMKIILNYIRISEIESLRKIGCVLECNVFKYKLPFAFTIKHPI